MEFPSNHLKYNKKKTSDLPNSQNSQASTQNSLGATFLVVTCQNTLEKIWTT